MASIHLQGILVDSVGEIDVGGVITFTHLTTTGETIASTKTELIIPPDGIYSIDVEYGQIRIDYTTRNTERFVANVIVNSASTATSLPELLSATTPVAKPIIIQMQGLVADATAAADTSEAFANQMTTFDLIGSAAVFASDTNITTKGYLTSGDGGSGSWIQNGVTGQTVSQSPAQLGNALLNDAGGNQWALVFVDEITPYELGFTINTATATNTNTYLACVNAAISLGITLKMGSGRHTLTEQFDLNDRITIEGSNRQDTQVHFAGSPTKSVQTYKIWRSEYDSGNYATSSDSAIAAGFKITGAQVTLKNMRVTGGFSYNVATPVVTPIASYPITSDFDCAILQQVTDFKMSDVKIEENFTLGGLYIDGSVPAGNTANDRGYYTNCKFKNKFALRIEGAYGQPISGDDYQDLNALDTRGAGGISDMGFYNCQFHDSDLEINTHLGDRLVREAGGGAIMITGQVSANAAGRIQGIRFYNCRAACRKDELILSLNYCNRVEFNGLHTEGSTSTAYDTDGTTLLTISDYSIKSTANSKNLKFFGGEKSGETDNLTYSDGANTLITLVGFDDATTEAQYLFSNNTKDQGAWTPVIAGLSVAGTQTYSSQSGRYVRVGNIVFAHCRISLSAFDAATSGNIKIEGLPYTSRAASGQETSGSVGFYNNLNLDAGFTQLCCAINDGVDYLELWQGGDNIGAALIDHANFNATTGLFLSIVYETTDPTGV